MIIQPPSGSCVETLRRAFSEYEEVTLGAGDWILDGEVDIGSKVSTLNASNGAKLIVPRSTSIRANILIRNRSDKPLLVEGLVIDFQAPASLTEQHAVLYSIDHSNLTLRGIKGSGLTVGHYIDVAARTRTVTGVVIEDCELTAATQEPSSSDYDRNSNTGGALGLEVLKVTGAVYRSTGNAPLAHYKARHDPGMLQAGVECVIRRNSIHGGYYGLSCEGITRSFIHDNVCSGNMRGMSLQNCCTNNAILWNSVEENLSAGIHLAYGCCWNLLMGNTVRSSRAHGEGLIQCYVASSGNIVLGNALSSTNRAVDCCKFYLYSAVDSRDNYFRSNTLSGACARAYVAVEGDWNPLTTDPHSRAYNTPKDGGRMASGDSSLYCFDNTVERLSPGTPYSYSSDALGHRGTLVSSGNSYD